VAVGGVNSNGLNFSGLSTGIDTTKIIGGLTKLNQRRIDALKSKEAGLTTKQAIFVGLQSKLFDLQTKTAALARAAGGAFDARTATTSDATAVTAAAGTAAAPGTYNLTVTALAQAQQVASQGFSDPNAQLKQGTLAIQVGSGAATTVTVDGRNNTLQGLADSINAVGGDAKATVINDGSAAGYRLMLTAAKTGAANGIVVTNGLTAGAGADIDPAAAVLQAATDAAVKLGSGPGAITVTSSTNQLNGLIPGLSVNLLRADPAKPVTLTVGNDTGGVAKGVQDFVDSFNAAVGFVNDQSKFDSKTRTAGVLLGNRDAAGIKNDLAAALNATIPGLGSAANRLSSVGLSFANDGTLALDQAKLGQALTGQTGAGVADLKRLFALSGTSDNPGLAFAFGSDKTKASGAGGYQVNLTTPAARAAVVATGPPAGAVVIGPANNALLLKLNGLTSSGITIPPGSYAPGDLTAILQQQINANDALKGNQVAVGLDGSGKLQITSQLYGSGSKVEITGGTALAALGFAGTETATGTDAAGSFTVGGQVEPATGSGQLLTGSPVNASTAGLAVRSTLTAPGTATVSVNQGLASRLNQVLTKYLDTTGGRLKGITAGYQANIDDIEKTITKQNTLLQTKTDELTLRFAAMESAVSNLKGIQSQLASLVNTTSN